MMYKSNCRAVGVAVAVLFFGVGCGSSQTRPSELAGQWEHASGVTSKKPKNLELFKDGTGVVDGGASITWKVENKRFVILSSSFALSCDYKVSGYELALAYDDSTKAIFVRKGKLEDFKAKRAAAALDYLSKQMVSVSGGTFTMGCTAEQGSDCSDYEKPAHSVTVGDFSIGKVEVTQGLWTAVMGENPSNFKGDDNLPVETVSWNDVQEFIQKLNSMTGKKYRLPTEAEWEYAARGGKSGKGSKYSGSNNIDDVAWYDGNSGGKTKPVGTKAPNELGIYDMSGNVWEWVSDWGGSYNSSPATNPQGPNTGSYRVDRGGSWNRGAWYCRVSSRDSYNPAAGSYGLGFRLAVSPQF